MSAQEARQAASANPGAGRWSANSGAARRLGWRVVSDMIMTEVSAVVASDRADDVAGAFAEVLQRPLPDGLIRPEPLAGRDGDWKVQTLWRDQAALDAMRAGPEPPAAPAMFRQLGAEPVLRIYYIRGQYAASS